MDNRGEAGGGAGRLSARVVTADEISSKLREETVAKLRDLVADDLEVEFETDKGLIGGMVVHLPDRTIDLSMAGRFRNYGRAVQELIGDHLSALESWARTGEAAAGEAGVPRGRE